MITDTSGSYAQKIVRDHGRGRWGLGDAGRCSEIEEAGEHALIRPVARPVPLRQSVYEALVELGWEPRLGLRLRLGPRLGRAGGLGLGRGDKALRQSSALIFSPAETTAAECSLPGDRVRRSIGPETEMAAMILPPWPRTGADTDATPASQPRRRTWAREEAVKRAPFRPRFTRSGSSHASRTWAAEPALMGSTDPTGTVSRSPVARSAAATQIRESPWRR